MLGPQALASVAEAHSALARRATGLAARREEWQEARRWFDQSRQAWSGLKQAGLSGGRFDSEPPEIDQRIAQCDAELQKLQRPTAR